MSGYVTKEQIERARQVNILDYILAYESDNVRRVGNSYRLKDHESLSATDGKWFWHSRGIGSKNAVDFLTEVRGYGLVEAVCTLLGENPNERHANKSTYSINPAVKNADTPQPSSRVKDKCDTIFNPLSNSQPQPTQPNRTSFALPIRNKDNRRVIAYLQSRGIDKGLILDCINHGILYESAGFHNAVFVGKDENGKSRFAALRGTTSVFKCDASGSDKKYGFLLPPSNPQSKTIAVFESGIDCLSHQTLCKQGFLPPLGGWRLSLGGTSTLALAHFLDTHANVNHCLICTDNDKAGEQAAARIAELPGITAERSPPGGYKDWNDLLLAAQKAERTRSKERQSSLPEL